MAKLPTLKKILREDMKDAPQWIESMLYILNLFMETIYYALKQNITFDENIAAFKKRLSFTTASNYTASPDNWTQIKFPNQLKVKPYTVFLAKISNLDNTSVTAHPSSPALVWDYVNGEILINYISGLGDSTRYSIDLLII